MTSLLSQLESATVFKDADVQLEDGLYESVFQIEYPDGTARDQPISLDPERMMPVSLLLEI